MHATMPLDGIALSSRTCSGLLWNHLAETLVRGVVARILQRYRPAYVPRGVSRVCTSAPRLFSVVQFVPFWLVGCTTVRSLGVRIGALALITSTKLSIRLT